MSRVVSEVSVSSHRALHSGKQASGSPQGGDQATPFEALLDSTTPESAPKKTPKADRTERPTASRRANEADSDPRDPNVASADSEPAADAATSADSANTAANNDSTGDTAETAEPETGVTQDKANTEEIAIVIAAIAQPAAQPVAAPVIAAAVTVTAPPVTADAEAGAALTGIAATGEAASPDDAKAVPQTAPVETVATDQTADAIKPEAAKAAEKSASDKPAADKAQAQPVAAEGKTGTEHRDAALADKKGATPAEPAEPANAKPAIPAKPPIEADAPRADTDARELSAKPADATQSVTLSAQTQNVHSSSAAAANQTQQAGPAVPVAGLAVEIAAQARAGKNRFEIRLDPPELGRIDVRLDMDKDGNVTSRMMVERSDTLDLLRRDAHALERALNQAGLKTADNALEFSLRDQGFANNDNKRDGARDGSQLIIPDDESPVIDAARGYGRLLGLGNGLDIRV